MSAASDEGPDESPNDGSPEVGPFDPDDLSELAGQLDERILGEAPSLTQAQVAERAGFSLEEARRLWGELGFSHAADDEVAFLEADADALKAAHELIEMGILSPDRQAALVRTWGRSFARLAEWQVSLLADVALDSGLEPAEAVTELSASVLPKVEALQTYVWRRHLVSASGRMLSSAAVPDQEGVREAVCFVDIVGYTSTSRGLDESELVEWLEGFESEALALAVEHDARILKNIGDELLLVADDVLALAEVALRMTERGSDDDDPFPDVRVGLAYGPVVSRLGDVFGPTVNVAARLTQAARPGTVLVDRGAREAIEDLEDDDAGDEASGDDAERPFKLRSIRPVSVKGYRRLHPWVLRRASGG